MKIREALKSAEIAYGEAEIFLAHILNKEKSWLLAHYDDEISDNLFIKFNEFKKRRKQNEPVAYIIGHKEFYGYDFKVDKNVLIPRPSTEYLIDAVLNFLKNKEQTDLDADTGIVIHTERYSDTYPKLIVDIGTGSGCIAVTLALEHPDMRIIATDISEKALNIAKINARIHCVENRIDFLYGDLLNPISDITQPFLLVSNPPYIPKGEKLMPDVFKFEPEIALRGGENGGEAVKSIIKLASVNPFCVGFCIECRENQCISKTDPAHQGTRSVT